jgi:hypothetical protein
MANKHGAMRNKQWTTGNEQSAKAYKKIRFREYGLPFPAVPVKYPFQTIDFSLSIYYYVETGAAAENKAVNSF